VKLHYQAPQAAPWQPFPPTTKASTISATEQPQHFRSQNFQANMPNDSTSLQTRDEHSIGVHPNYNKFFLNWIRSANLFKIQEPDRIWTELMEKKCGIFVVKRLHFFIILSFMWTWTLHLNKFLDCGWTWTEF